LEDALIHHLRQWTTIALIPLVSLLSVAAFAEESEESIEYVLLYRDAALHEAPDAEGRTHRAFAADREAASDAGVPRLLARVVADHGRWVEIEPAYHYTSICGAQEFLQGAGVTLRFFVARTDLAATVRRPVTVRHDDGTSVELRPGIPLEPVGGRRDRYLVFDEDLRFEVELSSQDVGHVFAAADDFESRWFDGTPTKPGSDFFLGGESVGIGDSDRARTVEVVREVGDQYLVSLNRACTNLVVAIDATDLDPSREVFAYGSCCARSGTIRGYGFAGSTYLAESGTPVYWPGGGRAGITTQSMRFGERLYDGHNTFCMSTVLVDNALHEAALPDEDQTVHFCLRDVDPDLVEP
jgi:hypothetical protein